MTKKNDGIKRRQQVPNIHVKDAAQQYEEVSQVLYRNLIHYSISGVAGKQWGDAGCALQAVQSAVREFALSV